MNAPPAASPSPATRRLRYGLGATFAGLTVFLVAMAEWRHGVSRWWHGDKVKLLVLVHGSWWWAACACAALVLALGLTARWWARSWPAVRPAPGVPAPRWLIVSVLILMSLGAAVRVPRLGLSLYNDEAHTFRAHLAGEIPKAHLGNPDKFRPVPWLSTLYENRSANNSLPFALGTRTSYEIWRALTGAPAGRIHETALRLPVLVCGVLSIGALAWLGLRLGGPGMALLAAGLAAFHPWHMRYSVEARSYGMLLLILPLVFLALEAALRSGRWRHWLLFGALQALAVSAWLGSAHLLAALYLTLGLMSTGAAGRERRGALLVPAVVAGVLAVALYLLSSLPLYIQLSRALQDPAFFKSPDPFPFAWFQDTAGFLGFGIPGLALDPAPAAQLSVSGGMRTPWGFALGAGIVLWLAGLAAGSIRFLRQGGAGLALSGAVAGGACLTWAYCTAKGLVFLKWYSLFLLPGLIVLLAAGLHRLLKSLSPAWRVILLLPFAAAWWPGLSCYISHGRENLRGAVELVRGAPYPVSLTNPAGSLYGITWSESPVYDPAAVTLKNEVALLHALIARARQENRPLYVSHGHSAKALEEAGEILKLLREPTQFRPVAVLPGLDETSNTHYVYQWIPSPAVPRLPAERSAPSP